MEAIARRETPDDERGPRGGSIVRVALHDFGRGFLRGIRVPAARRRRP